MNTSMKTSRFRSLALVAVAAAFPFFAGCADKPAEAPTTEETVAVEEVEEVEVPPVTTDGAAPAATDGAAMDAASTEVTAAMAELDEADRTAALAQKICPVSDEALGSMGKPLKVEVEGRTVFICCEGCRDPLLKEPAKYLAKLDAPAAQ
jgi:hypothetical protein